MRTAICPRGVWSSQGGAATGGDTPAFAPRLRDCRKRFASVRPTDFICEWSNADRDVGSVALGHPNGEAPR
eukprot:3489706-Pyramimonas_sp.AAC.1